MYSKNTNLVLGFHGCSKETFENVLYKGQDINPSTNDYDWLGSGIYFWENNLDRAKEWSRDHNHGEEYVIGAAIDLGHCLDLTVDTSNQLLERSYKIVEFLSEASGTPLPKNTPSKNGYDVFDRKLDCYVINFLCRFMEDTGEEYFDSVRGPFFEGGPLYNGSSLSKKTHIQIAVRNPNCIKGYFEPRSRNPDYPLP